MSNITKKILIVAIVLVLSSVFWIVVKPWVANPLRLSGDVQVWLLPLILFLVLIAVEGLALMLLKEGEWRLATVLAVGLPYLVVFGVTSSRWYLLALVLMMATSWLSVRNFVTESSQRFKINIYHIMRHGLPWLVTGIMIMISFAYFLSPETQATAKNQTLPPAVKTIVEKTVATFADSQSQSLTPQQKKSLISQATDEVMKQFTDAVRPYFKYMPPILAFGLFLILQGLSFIFVFLGVWLAVLLFQILKMSGLVKITTKEVKAETIEFV